MANRCRDRRVEPAAFSLVLALAPAISSITDATVARDVGTAGVCLEYSFDVPLERRFGEFACGVAPLDAAVARVSGRRQLATRPTAITASARPATLVALSCASK